MELVVVLCAYEHSVFAELLLGTGSTLANIGFRANRETLEWSIAPKVLVPKLLHLENTLTSIAISSFKLLLKKNHSVFQNVVAVPALLLMEAKHDDCAYTLIVEPSAELHLR